MDKNDSMPDIITNLCFWPILLLYNISKYWISPKREPKNFTWEYKFWDVVDYKGKEAIYHYRRWGNDYPHSILLEDKIETQICDDDDLKPLFRWQFQEELEILDKANKLQKEANKLFKRIRNVKSVFELKKLWKHTHK